MDVSIRENGTQTQSFSLIDSVGMIQISLHSNEITFLKIAITDRGNHLEKENLRCNPRFHHHLIPFQPGAM